MYAANRSSAFGQQVSKGQGAQPMTQCGRCSGEASTTIALASGGRNLEVDLCVEGPNELVTSVRPNPIRRRLLGASRVRAVAHARPVRDQAEARGEGHLYGE